MGSTTPVSNYKLCIVNILTIGYHHKYIRRNKYNIDVLSGKHLYLECSEVYIIIYIVHECNVID